MRSEHVCYQIIHPCSDVRGIVASHDHTAEFRFSSPESGGHSLGASTVVVEEEMMAALPVLTTGSQILIVLCSSDSLDAEGSQPPAAIPERHDLCTLGSLRHSQKHL